MINSKDLCLSLIKSESEEKVIKILKEAGYWDDEKVWKYFGVKENNWGEIGNQQSNADRALVEKIVNSVDAVLMTENYVQAQSDPNYNMPSSIKNALVRFFTIDEGKLSNITPTERTKLANRISLIATGLKSKPCYAIADNGEGQTPAKMPSTLLSLSASNKLRIPFVQGKFNMGGTGVLRFCGQNNLEFILSKRNPVIENKDSDATYENWGFTIVRRENPTDGVRSSTYKYLAPNNKVLMFNADELKILPGNYPEPYEKGMKWGTYIKLYDYDIGNLKTNINLNLNYRLSLLLPQIALPIRLFERRKGYEAHSYDTTLSGLDVRLEDDKSKNLEEKYKFSGKVIVMGETISYSIYPFKPGKNKTYTNNEGIIFTVNGQTHGHISKHFYSRNKVGLGYLADSLLMIADCSEFSGRATEDLFKNDRETLVNCPLKNEIERAFEDELKNHKGLRQLQEERKRADITEKLADSKPLADILTNIIRKSPALSSLLALGQQIKNPFDLRGSEFKEDYVGKEFPTFFKLKKEYPLNRPKQAQIGRRLRIQFKTDVENNYFDRAKDKGSSILFLNGQKYDNASINLWNGTGTLSISFHPNVKVGEKFSFKLVVSDVKNDAFPFENVFQVETITKKRIEGSSDSTRIKPTSGTGNNDKIDSALALPEVIPIRKDDWYQHDFDSRTSLRVIPIGDNKYDFKINLDNQFLLSEQKLSKNNDDIKLIEARFQYGLVIIALGLLGGIDKKSDNDDDKIFHEMGEIMDRISPVMIPIINQLGELKLEHMQELVEEV